MKQVAIIYWSGTGNTETMANAIAEGAVEAGHQVTVKQVSEATVADVKEADVAVLGCPSMGDEVLEETEMEPFVDGLSGDVSGKSVALFGSYGWGSGEWMEEWEGQMRGFGAELVHESLILNETPDDVGITACKAFGKAL